MDESDLLVKDPEKLEEIYFVAYNIIARTILVVGILGNVLSIVVLTRPNMKASFVFLSDLYEMILESDVHLLVVAVRVELGHLDYCRPRTLEHLPGSWRE